MGDHYDNALLDGIVALYQLPDTSAAKSHPVTIGLRDNGILDTSDFMMLPPAAVATIRHDNFTSSITHLLWRLRLWAADKNDIKLWRELTKAKLVAETDVLLNKFDLEAKIAIAEATAANASPPAPPVSPIDLASVMQNLSLLSPLSPFALF